MLGNHFMILYFSMWFLPKIRVYQLTTVIIYDVKQNNIRFINGPATDLMKSHAGLVVFSADPESNRDGRLNPPSADQNEIYDFCSP